MVNYVKADPGRPYKMYAAIIVAFLTSYITTSSETLPVWAVGVLTAACSALAVYITPNPSKRNR